MNERDTRFGISTAEKRKERADIPMPDVDPMANAWEKKHLRQFVITDNIDSALRRHHHPATMD